MCTLSWLPSPKGYTLWFNRDERLTRALGRGPTKGERNGIPYLAPQDPEAGGTWIGVNAAGVTVCLANRYGPAPGARPGTGRVSRGMLVLSLVGSRSLEAATRALSQADLSVYQPFTIGLFAPGEPARLAVWDGSELSFETEADPGIVVISSAVDQAAVAQARHAALAAALAEAGTPVSEAVFDRLHRSHTPWPSSLSVCMHREDAQTVSLSRIEVGPDVIRFQYTPGAPCTTKPNDPVILGRVAPAPAR